MSEKKKSKKPGERSSISRIYFSITVAVLVMISVYAGYKLLDVENDPDPIKVSVVVEDSGNSRWSAFMAGIEQAASDHNVSLSVVTTTVFERSTDMDMLVKQERDDGADYIITSPGEHIYPDPAEQIGHLFTQITEDYGMDLSGRNFILLGADPKDEYDIRRMNLISDKILQAGGAVSVRVTRPYEASKLIKSTKIKDVIIALDDRSLLDSAQYMSVKKGRKRRLYGIGCSPANVYYLDHRFISGMVVTDEFTRGYESIMHIVNASDTDVIVSSYSVRPEEIYEEENQRLLFP